MDTPVPIPNTEVKHFNGDNSWACPCEDSKLLGHFFMSDPLYLHVSLRTGKLLGPFFMPLFSVHKRV